MLRICLALVALYPGVFSQAWGCEPMIFGRFADTSAYSKPIKINPDCSFDHEFVVKEATYKVLASISAGAVRDLGNGRVAQRVSNGGSCSLTEQLLFIDCATADLIAIEGIHPKRDWEIGGLSERRVEDIQKPKGPIELGPNSSIAGLVKIAEANGFNYKRDLEDELAGLKRKNRYDPFCGCKLYYPDLAEASQ